jgi:hypothetical protein
MATAPNKITKHPKVTSPKGEALYPYLLKPQTKFDENGTYSVKLRVPVEDAKEYTDKLDALLDSVYEETCATYKKDAKKITKQLPYELEVDDDGNETGNVIIKFKKKAKIITKTGEVFINKVFIFDAKGKEAQFDSLWSGSLMKVNAFPATLYMVGTHTVILTLQLNAVQVIKAASADAAKMYGFSDESDGTEEEAAETTEAGEAADTPENDDF